MEVIVPSIIDPFHRAIHLALSETIHNHILFVSSGSLTNFEDYKYKTGYINGMRDALSKCQELEENMYGQRPGE